MSKKIYASKFAVITLALALIVLIVTFVTPVVRASSASIPQTMLAPSLEEHLSCRRAIEQVYWDYTQWPEVNPTEKPPLEEVLTDDQISAKLTDTLAQSVALSERWDLSLTTDMLQAEMDRMAAYSQRPEQLRELFAALGNDPALVAECLVFPTLVERLIQQQYVLDEAIHAGLRNKAQNALSQVSSAYELADLPNSESIIWELDSRAGAPEIASVDGVVLLDEAAFENHAAHVRQAFNLPPGSNLPIGQVSPLQEDASRFYAVAVVDASNSRIQVLYAAWTKQPFESWWEENRQSFDIQQFSMPAGQYRLPVISAASSSINSSDFWQYMPALPWATVSSESVWTGSVMLVWGGAYTTNGFRYDPVLDDWRPITTLNAPHGRHSFTAVWTGTEMIVYGGCNGGTEFCTDGSGGRYNPLTDTWASIAYGSARRQHTAVWSGTEMLVWGGCTEDPNGNQNCNTLVTQGARYNPSTNSWSSMTLNNAPSGARNPESIWAGDQMIIWNGTGGINGRYFPDSDSWQNISTTNAPPGLGPSLVWTGNEMIAWGGCTGANGCPIPRNEGGRYNPLTDTWSPTNLVDAPGARSTHTAVWTGEEMIVWGGWAGGGNFLDDGSRYDPQADSWTAINSTGSPSARGSQHAHWSGQVMIIWGGTGFGDERTGGRYNPLTDSWMPTSTNDPQRVSTSHASVWDGTHMISWGGEGEYFIDSLYQRARLYDPATDIWSISSQNPDLPYFSFSTAVWTGTEMIIWGGQYGNSLTNLGARYNPMTDSWIQTSLTNAPEERSSHSAVWTGSEMIVWGGSVTSDLYVQTGGRYDPLSDSWTATTLTGAPLARNLHQAAWTGSEMIVWGGRTSTGATSTGSRYDPATDSWTSMTLTNAPAARLLFASVWTGSEYVIWGGGVVSGGWNYDQTGGRYDPAADSWTPTSLVDAPEGRARFSGVWTGEEMVVWGGCNDVNCLVKVHTGGRYNPTTDSWIPTTNDHVIEGREFHTMVWTGSEVLIWGGQTNRNGYTHTGGRYFFPTSGNIAPLANADAYSLQAGTTLTVTAPGVLDNDMDVDGDVLTATLVTTPTHGSLTFSQDGSFIYEPDADFTGTDNFHYQASDGQATSNVAIVSLNIMPGANQAPTASDDTYTTTMNIQLVVDPPGVLENDGDSDGDSLQAVLVTGPTDGQLLLDPDGGFSYEPDIGFVGQDSFTYQAFDGLAYSAPATVTINVEPMPEFAIWLPLVQRP